MKKISPVFVLTAGCLWGSMGIFVRGLGDYGFSSMEIVALRVFGALLFLTIGILLYNKKLFCIKLKDIWCFIGTGVISIVFFNFCYFNTIQMTSLSVAAILLYTAPAIVTVSGIILFKESVNRNKIIALFLAFTGCLLVTGVLSDKQPLTFTGVLLGLGSGFGYAMYSIFGRYALGKGYHTLTITLYTFLFGSIGVLPFLKTSHLIHNVVQKPEACWLILGLILFNTIAAYLTYTIGLSYMEAGRASILASIEPVVATVIGFLLYKERLSAITIIGIMLVLVSSVLVNLTDKSK